MNIFQDSDCESIYQILQSNGQRICFPRNEITSPPKGSEVFVGNLPNDMFEDEIIPLFSEAGLINKLRLMMDFYGTTRGFAFITYYNVESAHNAVHLFNGFPVREDMFLTVQLSVDNRRLFIGNISRRKTAQEIQDQLKHVLDGVSQVIVYSDLTNSKMNRGFAFVEFENHAQAAIARRQLMVNNAGLLWGKNTRVIVDWAHPEPVIHPVVLMQIKILYFKNIPITCSQRRFRESLCNIIAKEKVERIYKKDNYAFVHFVNRTSAEQALRQLHSERLVIHNRMIEVEWARPVNYSRKVRETEIPNNSCMSVPPTVRRMIVKSKKKYYNRNQACTGMSSSSGHSSEHNVVSDDCFLTNSFSQLTLF